MSKLLMSLFQYKAWANRGLFEALRAAPKGQNPTEMLRITLILDHVAVVDRIFKARLSGEQPAFAGVVSEVTPTLDALWRDVEETDRWYVDYTDRVTEAELGEAVDFTFLSDGEPGHMTKAEMLGHVLTHGQSHRAALGWSIEKTGAKPPPDMFSTYLHKAPGVRA
jgi:uncharacterized damage-inducible protein DinB